MVDGIPQAVARQHDAAILDPLRSIRRLLRFGLALVFVFSAGLVAAATVVAIHGAVVAHGRVVVAGNVKRIQHPDGGIVAAIHVQDGSRVKAGDVLLRLDDTATRAELGIVQAGLTGNLARFARLLAERDGLAEIGFPEAMRRHGKEQDVAAAIAGETTLFESRRKARLGEVSQLKERIDQIAQEVRGLAAQLHSTREQITVSKEELGGVEPLFKKGLTTVTRLNQLKRSITSLEGQEGELLAQVARARTRISETELQITQVEKAFVAEVGRELREVEDRVREFDERRVAAQARLGRIEIKAPIAGIVNQLAVHTIGGVINPGDPIMVIVPEDDPLIVEAQFETGFIDQVRVGQPAVVRFPALNQRVTPELKGEVTFVSPDLEADQRTGAAYYRARVGFSPEQLARLGDLKLSSGMPAEVFIQTNERTVLSYLLKPLQDQIGRAFRER